MPVLSSKKPYRVARSRTGLGLFATKRIKKGSKIIRYFGPLLDCKKKKEDAIENKYLFELNNRWTIDGSVRKNIARYINHACKPNAESDVRPRKRKVFIRAVKNIEPGDEINYDYGTDYFKAYLKPIGCKCDACENKRKKKRAEVRAERLRLKAKELKKAERKAKKKAEKAAAKRAENKSQASKSLAKSNAKNNTKAKLELKPDRKRKLDSKSKTPARTSPVRLKTGARPVKSRVAAGLHLNGSAPRRQRRPKSAVTRPVTADAAEQPAAVNLEAVTFQASSLAVPAASANEAQQASA